MKYTSIKTAIVLAVAALSTSALAAPSIYGQIRLNTQYEKSEEKVNGVVTEKTDRPTMNSGNSRLGFKGSEKLNDKLDLEYRLEYKIDVAESTSKNFSARHGYLALNHKDYGRLLAGRTITEDDNISSGNAWLWGTGIGPFYGHDADWSNNGFMYTTPKFNNGTTDFFVQYGMDEGIDTYDDEGKLKDKKGSRTFETFRNGALTEISRDFVVAGAHYEKDNNWGGIAYTRAGDDLSALRVAGNYEINQQWSVNGTAQYTDNNNEDNELALYAGVAYKPKEPLMTWVEVAYVDKYKGYRNGEVTGANVGASYDFSKNLLGFANVGYYKEKYDATEVDKKGVEIGAVYKF